MDKLVYFKDFLCKIYDENNIPIKFIGSTKEEHTEWKQNARAELCSLLKLDIVSRYMTKSIPSHVSDNEGIYGIYELKSVETFPSVFMEYCVLKPKKSNGRAVMAVHGHGSNGKEMLVGNISEHEKYNLLKYNYTYASELANLGYTVYVPDLLGSGKRVYLQKAPFESSCNEINFFANAIGINLQGLIISELMKLSGIIEKDGFKNIGVCGFSGGGLFCLLLAAVCERIKYTIASGYLHSYKSTLMTNNFCGCNFVPELQKRFDIGDFCALIAPRFLACECGNRDEVNLDSLQTAEYIKKIYNIYAEDNFIFKMCDGEHRWYGAVLDYFDEKNRLEEDYVYLEY